jgi:hypothetical protein
MKAALEAWGSKTNHFHQGFAKESDDPEIIAATMAKPGVVLRRAVGSRGSFSEHPELPKNLANDKVKEPAGKRAPIRAQNHGRRFEGIPNPNLQENRRQAPQFRLIRRPPEFLQSSLSLRRFGIFHGRLFTRPWPRSGAAGSRSGASST